MLLAAVPETERCAPGPLRVTWSLTNQTAIVILRGELDISGVPKATSALAVVDDLDAPKLCLDLRTLSFLDASGVGVLARVWSRCEAGGVRTWLLLRPGPVARTRQLVGVPDGVNLVETAERAAGPDGSLSRASLT